MSKKLTHHSPHFQLVQERQRHHLLRHLPLFPCPSNVVEPVLSNWNLVNPSFDDGGSSLSSTTDMPLMPVSLSGSHACKCQAPLGPGSVWKTMDPRFKFIIGVWGSNQLWWYHDTMIKYINDVPVLPNDFSPTISSHHHGESVPSPTRPVNWMTLSRYPQLWCLTFTI